jgi:hypothetical protein
MKRTRAGSLEYCDEKNRGDGTQREASSRRSQTHDGIEQDVEETVLGKREPLYQERALWIPFLRRCILENHEFFTRQGESYHTQGCDHHCVQLQPGGGRNGTAVYQG